MDFSSSSSSSSSKYRSSAIPANTSRPRWDLPIYDSTPHFPHMESGRLASSSSPSYSNYTYNYPNHDYGGGRAAEMMEKREEGGDPPPEEKEHMFNKVVTPSDVGKLNRLVIPKQHAEKYFPLDSSSSDKGLLLDFEDRTGKSWRFRYSYWNSSQSYVMTKGWSRFVKEKKLDAGDVVSFHRNAAKDRFYIDWRCRPNSPPPPPLPPHHIQFQHGFSLPHRSILLAGPRPPHPLVLHHHRDNNSNINYGVLTPNFCHQGSVVYMRDRGPPQHHQMQMQMELAATSTGGATSDEPMVLDSVPVAAPGKRLRLFGVNMDCSQDSEAPVAMSTHSSISAEEAEAAADDGSLDLRLHGSATTNFLDKGKSSMTLDLDL